MRPLLITFVQIFTTITALTWSCYNQSCYTFLQDDLNNSQAVQACAQIDTQLAELETVEKMRYMQDVLFSLQTEYWVGLDVVVGELFGIPIVDYRWRNSQMNPLDEFWGANEPSGNTEDDECVRLTYIFDIVHLLGDNVCSANYKAICERKINTQVQTGQTVSMLYNRLRVTNYTFACAGQPKSNSRKLECAHQCTSSSTCIGFEWEATPGDCILYTASSSCNITQTKDIYLRN